MKKIRDDDLPVPDENQEPTSGIEVDSGWTFKYGKDNSITFTSNMWDFGGQQVQYMLHQFFLTPRSLYVLLSDKRKQNTDFNYWFNIIELLGGGSPVLVVFNEMHKYKSHYEFEYKTYRERYKGIKNIIKKDVDLSETDELYYDLMKTIKSMLSELDHIGEDLPKSWTDIRKRIENLSSQNVINYEAYAEICNEFGLTDEFSVKNLLNHLNNIGVVLYFDDDYLADTIYVNPYWVMNSIYKVVCHEHIFKNNGKFEKDWLFNFWQSLNCTQTECVKLINLMKKDSFEICYKLEGTAAEQYLIPILLPQDNPSFTPFEGASLKYKIKYDFLPKGFVSRLSVRLNEFIDREYGIDLIWNKGVILKKDGCRAMVKQLTRELDKEDSIEIMIDGDEYYRKDLFTLIREEIRKIHKKSFRNISFEEVVPCSCTNCRVSETPEFYTEKKLRNLVKNDKRKITCQVSDDDVLLISLLEGIFEKKKYYDKENEYYRKDEDYDSMKKLLYDIDQNVKSIKDDIPAKEQWYKKWYYIALIVGAIIAAITGIKKAFFDSAEKKNSSNDLKDNSRIEKIIEPEDSTQIMH